MVINIMWEENKNIVIYKDSLDNYKEIEKQYDDIIKANNKKIIKYDYSDRIIYERKEDDCDRF